MTWEVMDIGSTQPDTVAGGIGVRRICPGVLARGKYANTSLITLPRFGRLILY